jgi:hypothetical protein
MGIRNITTLDLIRILAGLTLCSPLIACSSTNFSNFKYVSRDSLKNDSLYLTEQSQSTQKKPTSYGALKYQTEEMNDNEGYLFLLQKKKSLYQAETMFKSTKDKKYYFSFGIDARKKGPAVGFRVEF